MSLNQSNSSLLNNVSTTTPLRRISGLSSGLLYRDLQHAEAGYINNPDALEIMEDADMDLPIQVFRCVPCSRRKVPQTSTATTVCDDCNKAMCGPCASAHEGFFEEHSTRVVLHRPLNPNNGTGLKCQRHPTRNIEAYCVDDEALVCPSCVLFGEHNRHQTIDLPAAIVRNGVETLIAEAKTRKSLCEEAISLIRQEQELVRSRLQHCLEVLTGSRQRVLQQCNDTVNSVFDGFESDVKGLTTAKMNTLRAQEEETAQHVEDISGHMEAISALQAKSDHARLLDHRQHLIQLVESSNTLVLVPKTGSDLEVIRAQEQDVARVLHQDHVLGLIRQCDAEAGQSQLQGTPNLNIDQPTVFTVVWQPGRLVDVKAITTQLIGSSDCRVLSITTAASQGHANALVSMIEVVANAEFARAVLLRVSYRGADVNHSPMQLITPAPTKCEISGPLLVASRNRDAIAQNQPLSLIVKVFGSDGTALSSGGTSIQAYSTPLLDDDDGGLLMRQFFDPNDGADEEVEGDPLVVIDNQDGTYEIVHAAAEPGQEQVHVRIHGQPLPFTPFVLSVHALLIHGGSLILTEAWMQATLRDMLPQGRRELTKLMDSRDGRHTTMHFHQAVMQKGQILVVLKHHGSGRVFGGFVEDTFNGVRRYIAGHSSNFIFSLVEHRPIKLVSSGNGVYMGTSTHGFAMGGGHDLQAFAARGSCNPNSYTTAAPGYRLPPQLQPGVLSGGFPFWSDTDVLAEVYQCS